jgi:hypothetical protein
MSKITWHSFRVADRVKKLGTDELRSASQRWKRGWAMALSDLEKRIAKIERRLNMTQPPGQQPFRILTPVERFNACVASTG